MSTATSLREDLGALGHESLRIRARSLAAGFYGGHHRAAKKGSGIEFAGHRAYSPGDDLRHLDRHAFLRHGRLLIKEFHSDTDRAVFLIVDCSPSMHYRSDPQLFKNQTAAKNQTTAKSQESRGPYDSKLSQAVLVTAALAFIARRTGDPIGLALVGAQKNTLLLPRQGGEQLERIFMALEAATEPPEAAQERTSGATDLPTELQRLTALLPRGTEVFLFSDFFDFDPTLDRELANLSTGRRRIRAIQVLDPAEASFPFQGALRLKDAESDHLVETDGKTAQAEYLEALEALTSSIHQALVSRGGDLSRLLSNADAGDFLQRLLSNR